MERNESIKYTLPNVLARWRELDEEIPTTDTEGAVCTHNAILHLLNSGRSWGSNEVNLIVNVRLGKWEGK